MIDDISLDKYTFVRDAYLQRRRSLVFDGDVPEAPDQQGSAGPAGAAEDAAASASAPAPARAGSAPARQAMTLPASGVAVNRRGLRALMVHARPLSRQRSRRAAPDSPDKGRTCFQDDRCCGFPLCSGRRVRGRPRRRPVKPPEALIKEVSTDVLDIGQGRHSIRAGDVQKVIALVDTKVMPYVDFQRMTASAVGRYWRQATPDQQKRLQDEFKMLLVRTYSGALAQVKDQTVS